MGTNLSLTCLCQVLLTTPYPPALDLGGDASRGSQEQVGKL